MKKALACIMATAVVGAAAACTPKSASLGTVGSAADGKTHTGTAAPSTSSGAMDQSGAMNGSTTTQSDGTSSSADSGSFVQPGSYTFRTVNNGADPTFNQLLGINNSGIIAGYFGSGAQGHPNKGYRVGNSGGYFVNENFPGSAQTQVTAINNHGVTVGFWSAMNNANQMNDNTGFYYRDGAFHQVAFPTGNKANPPVNQLLGINDYDNAVGFYTDGAGNNHGYEYNIDRHSFHTITVSRATSTTATAINYDGDIAGFFTGSGGATEGFLLTAHGTLTSLAYPGASMTQALGVNDHREVVGFYQVGTGDGAQTHGFTWTARGGFKQVDDPAGAGTTTVNGVNDAGVLVGFYVDGAGNTDGMLATPSRPTARHLSLAPMPTGSVTLHRDGNGNVTANVTATGLTPGSSHTVEIDAPGPGGATNPIVRFAGPLTADATGAANATLQATGSVRALPYGSRFVIRLGTIGNDATNSGGAGGNTSLAAEPIARSGQLSSSPWGTRSSLTGIDVNTNGVNLGPLTGQATIAYDAAAHTLTVTLNASGLTPGAHAAHIHSGSCQSQGAVLYMLMDFQADARGNVADQTRTVTGVDSMPAGGTWYLNVHQGDSNTIVANGAPALPFRPLLCANG